jgi:hypothetical protein
MSPLYLYLRGRFSPERPQRRESGLRRFGSLHFWTQLRSIKPARGGCTPLVLVMISRPRYREIEAGSSVARTTTLINIARALGLELMLIPQAMVPAVEALLRPHDDLDDLPAFVANPDGERGE